MIQFDWISPLYSTKVVVKATILGMVIDIEISHGLRWTALEIHSDDSPYKLPTTMASWGKSPNRDFYVGTDLYEHFYRSENNYRCDDATQQGVEIIAFNKSGSEALTYVHHGGLARFDFALCGSIF